MKTMTMIVIGNHAQFTKQWMHGCGQNGEGVNRDHIWQKHDVPFTTMRNT